jgi:hypothetical protein
MDERSIRNIMLARYYLHLAAGQLQSEADTSKFAAIDLYHEALETTLITCADHLNAKVSASSSIETYFDKIDNKLAGLELPMRTRLLQFNKARVAAKHHLTLPERSFLERIGVFVPEFIHAAVRMCCGTDIEDVSLLTLLENPHISAFIAEAQERLRANEAYDSLLAASKAFYLQFEASYDIRKFSDPEKALARGVLSDYSFCRAPAYAKRPDYIKSHVTKPSEFIVLDHARIDNELMKEGVDVQTFWNIWRLTPRMYYFDDANEWVAEWDPSLANDPNVSEHCQYVIDTLITIILQMQYHQKKNKVQSAANTVIRVVANAAVFEKADRASALKGRLPDYVTKVNVNRKVAALNRDGEFWHISYFRKGGPSFWGYLHQDDSIGEPEQGYVIDGLELTGIAASLVA